MKSIILICLFSLAVFGSQVPSGFSVEANDYLTRFSVEKNQPHRSGLLKKNANTVLQNIFL